MSTPRKQLGRRPVAPEVKRASVVSVHVTAAEKAAILADAKARGVSASELLASIWRSTRAGSER